MSHFEELTPTPVAVESPIKQPDAAEVSRSRGFLKRALVPATVAASLVLPGVIDSFADASRAKAKAALSEVAESERNMPLALQMAHHSVSSRIFGNDPEGLERGTRLARSIAVNLNEHEFDQPGAWQLNVEDFVGDDVTISEDGKSFIVRGTKISLSHGLDGKGNAYVLGGQTEMEDGKLRLINPGLIGAAPKAEDIEADQLREQAGEDARQNLARFLRTELAFADTKK